MNNGKLLFLDLGMGAAGDMLNAALYELLDEDKKKKYTDIINSLGIDDVKVCAEQSVKCGVTGTHMSVLIDGITEDEHHHVHGHHHEHDHEHEHHHEHTKMDDIADIIGRMPVSDKVKNNATSIYSLIAEAESRAHNKAVSEIHFHEVGNKDAIVDVTGFCILMEELGVDSFIATPVCTGFGKVKCAHGILPVPAPATAGILEGVPSYAGDIEGEMCTPTGAAIVRHFASDFRQMPLMTVERTGYGMGGRDYGTANCVRAMIGRSGIEGGDIVELSCNVDDMTGEAIGYVTGLLMTNGALDVYTTAIGMKKGRPGVRITVMCAPSDKQKFVSLLFANTTTIGIRESMFGRYVLDRVTRECATEFGNVRVKTSEGYGVRRDKIEFDDIITIADKYDLPADEVRRRIECKINE